MLHNVYHMYCEIKSMDKAGSTKKPTFDISQDMPTNQATLKDMMKMPSNINGVQLQPYQVWSCNRVGFAPSGNW